VASSRLVLVLVLVIGARTGSVLPLLGVLVL